MSLYRLERYSTGDGDPIDTSDALSILAEVKALEREHYNKGIDAAIKLVEEYMDYENRITGLQDAIICGLENSKK